MRQRGRQTGRVFGVPDPAEASLGPQLALRHSPGYHVLLVVPALHIARRLTPVAQNVVDEVRAQERGIERRRRFQPLERQ